MDAIAEIKASRPDLFVKFNANFAAEADRFVAALEASFPETRLEFRRVREQAAVVVTMPHLPARKWAASIDTLKCNSRKTDYSIERAVEWVRRRQGAGHQS